MLTFPDSLSSSANADRPALVLDEAGVWQYAGTDVVAVGARDITLAEVVNPLIIGRAGQEPEAVLLPLSAIIDDARLNWVLQEGTRLDGGGEPKFEVPWSIWQEHAEAAVDAWLPECDATGIDRPLAAAEREFRFTKQALEAAGLVRQRLVILATRLGRSRREVGETLGLSTGRVQQLNEDPPDELVAEVEEFIGAAALLAARLENGVCPRQDLPRPREFGADQLDQVVDSMLVLGLLEEVIEGLRLTDDGRALLDTAAKRAAQKTDADRERASNAAR